MKATELIISEQQKSLSFKGLKINKLDSPITSGYPEEWDIQDSEGWNYAGFGVKNSGYEYTLTPTNLYPLKLNQQSIWCKVRLSDFIN
jgi:hypothetical protein